MTPSDPRLKMSERALQSAVCLIATQRGWWWYHPADNRPDRHGRVQNIKAGFPDLIMVRGCCLLVAELKTTQGRVAPEQREWLDRLAATGARAFVWRPIDLLTGHIAEVLA